MLDSTLELINLAASNSLAVFCVCNLIIAILLVGTSKPQINKVKHPNAIPAVANAEHSKKGREYLSEEANVLIERNEEDIVIGQVHMVNKEEESSFQEEEEENSFQEEEEDGKDDELRKRVEEFIEKINRGWEAEKQKI